MKEYELDIELVEKVGLELIAVPVGDLIEVDLRLESVAEGVLVSANIYAIAKGECIRCLDPVEIQVDRRIQELYLYKKRSESKKVSSEGEDPDGQDELLMDGDILDLELPIRDAIVLSLPSNPLCDEGCTGLCQDCGLKWRELPEDHAHETIDIRWAGLSGLSSDGPDFKN